MFDEDFVFEVRPATIGRRTLEIILYDFDAYSRHHSIGGIQIPLSNVDLSERVDLWRAVDKCSEQDSRAELGDLMVSLAYLPSAERLTVVVIKARNLRVVDDTRTSSGIITFTEILYRDENRIFLFFFLTFAAMLLLIKSFFTWFYKCYKKNKLSPSR